MTLITAYTLRHLARCERRVWLDQHGDPSLRNEIAPHQFISGIEHESMIQEAMFGPVTSIPTASWSDMVQATADLMSKGVAGIKGAAFEQTVYSPHEMTVRGRVDWLRRVAQPSQLGNWSYEPIEIKQRKELKEADLVQLDLYLWLLKEAQGAEPSGWFWLGHDEYNQPLRTLEHSCDAERLQTAFKRLSDILDTSTAPDIFLASHCKECHWYSACTEVAVNEHDFTLLPGLSQPTWEHMRREGIRKLDDVAALSPQELQHFKGIGTARAQEMLASAQAMMSGKPVLRDSLPETIFSPGAMLDLETRLDNGMPWCFGWQGANGRVQVAIVAANYRGRKLTLPDRTSITIVNNSDTGWRMVAKAAQEVPGLVYHWGGFEQQVLHATAPKDVIKVLENRLHDLNRTFKRSYALPVRGTSIKKVAPYLGFHWPEGTNALSAWDDYKAWLLDNDRHALSRACAYNRADVEALALIWEWMIEQQPT